MPDAAFLGGPYDGMLVGMERTPPTVEVAGLRPTAHLWDAPNPEEPAVSMMLRHRYAALRDPDTGDYLGGYIYQGSVPG